MNVVIIDDEMNICLTLKDILEDEGYSCSYYDDGKRGITGISKVNPDLVFLDVRLDGLNGLDVLQQIKEINSEIAVIMISGHSGIKEAVQAIKLGAYDFLEKPLSLAKVRIAAQKAIQFKLLNNDYNRLRLKEDEKYKIVGNSSAMQSVIRVVNKVAPNNSKVLIRGESGTGKELVAYAIHKASKRFEKPFVKFNSAAIPNELVESELFGFEKGAFTGAEKSKEGKIEQADGGTLFLDEIGDMNLNAQAKILRVIQEGEFERIGSNTTRKIDTRIVAATHKNLEKMVVEGSFREDLFYRLNVIPIQTPPLRSRPEDIPQMVEHFAAHYAKELNIKAKKFSADALQTLQGWQFKGNVRQLRNLVERLYIMIESEIIETTDLEMFSAGMNIVDFWNETTNLKEKKKEFETKYISTQLRLKDGNISKTADALGLQVSNLSRKIKELNIGG